MTAEGAPPPVVPAPGAPAGAADATRRWALRAPDGDRFAGLTRPEAEAAAAELAALPVGGWTEHLVEIRLPAVLSDDAGPHLLDADGRITLALGAHPVLAGLRVAMGEPAGRGARHAVGAVRRRGGGPLWAWAARAPVPHGRRIDALDELAACADAEALAAWRIRWSAEGEGG